MSTTPCSVRPGDAYDAVVVGARAAGAATALLLARRGLRVLAVDRSVAGSDTLSTHALLRGAVQRLERWGVLPSIWAAGTPVVTRTAFHYGDEAVWFEGLGDDTIPGLAAPRRTVLDPALAAAAADAGATVLHGTRCVDLLRGAAGRVAGVRLALHDGTMVDVRADLVVGADGRRSAVASHVGAPVTRRGRAASAFAFRYVAGADLPTDAYQWLYRPGAGAGVIPTNGGHCVFVAVPPAHFRRLRGDLGVAMGDILQEVRPALAAAVRAGRPAGPVRSWPGEPGRFRRPHGPGWALVGDAGYWKDPFAAHGITDALRDAELLADAVVDGDLQGYERRRDELSLPVFEVLERIASYEWDLGSLPELHLRLARAMRDEERATAP